MTSQIRIKLSGTLTAPSDDKRFVSETITAAQAYLVDWDKAGQPAEARPVINVLRNLIDSILRIESLYKPPLRELRDLVIQTGDLTRTPPDKDTTTRILNSANAVLREDP